MSPFLTDRPIVAEALLQEVAAESFGATTLFLGTVRRSDEDGPVEGIEYSAYAAMAEAEFGRIQEEAAGRWPQARIAIRHRIGYIPTGEASIAIAVGAPHRAEAYECSRFLIEQIKERVPVWKKEKLGSADERWVQPSSRHAVKHA